jgi:DNA invertase Pin-like site-specific DNA recombinase
MSQMMGVFAEFERAMIRERVKAGLKRARTQGKTLGRPTITKAIETAIRKALKKGDVDPQDRNHARRRHRHRPEDQGGDGAVTSTSRRRLIPGRRAFGAASET